MERKKIFFFLVVEIKEKVKEEGRLMWLFRSNTSGF